MLSTPRANIISTSFTHIIGLRSDHNHVNFQTNGSKFKTIRVTIHPTGLWSNDSSHSNVSRYSFTAKTTATPDKFSLHVVTTTHAWNLSQILCSRTGSDRTDNVLEGEFLTAKIGKSRGMVSLRVMTMTIKPAYILLAPADPWGASPILRFMCESHNSISISWNTIFAALKLNFKLPSCKVTHSLIFVHAGGIHEHVSPGCALRALSQALRLWLKKALVRSTYFI